MAEQNIIQNRGTVVARLGTGLLFIESPEHFYAVGNADTVQLQVGDQFANVSAVNGRRLP